MTAYVIYNKDSTRYLCKHEGMRKVKEYFAIESAAKSALTRAAKTGKINKDEFLIAESRHFQANIEKKEMRQNFMPPHTQFEVGVNAGYATCPSSETYWST